ncbi:hypothetical protein [Marseilla massiliensis]|uniref:hypothetical protein n=1 Tax=Marseilla massiliensis TaxID=1841864 RepID=UPI0020136411|nr:hypothetical protein [Marseilla massiliensis]MCL1609505.1 hypothetical protein [Marseilla massiliensis]
MIFTKLINKWRSLRYYVIADPSDNSVTLSKRLFFHMKKCAESSGVDGASVFVFRIPQGGTFGFMLSPEISEPTQLCQIQYNGKYRCIGFETLCPSVGRIFFEYGLPALRPVKLSVSVRQTPQGKTYYQFDLPTHKTIRLCRAYSETRAKRT